MFEKFFLKNTIKTFTRGVWTNFNHKITEKQNLKLKISHITYQNENLTLWKNTLEAHFKTVSSTNLKTH